MSQFPISFWLCFLTCNFVLLGLARNMPAFSIRNIKYPMHEYIPLQSIPAYLWFSEWEIHDFGNPSFFVGGEAP